MMTSSNGNIFRVSGTLCGEFTGPGEFPTQRPVTRSFDVFFMCIWINGWVNTRQAGDLRCYRGHYDVIIMTTFEKDASIGLWWSNMWSSLFLKSRITFAILSACQKNMITENGEAIRLHYHFQQVCRQSIWSAAVFGWELQHWLLFFVGCFCLFFNNFRKSSFEIERR